MNNELKRLLVEYEASIVHFYAGIGVHVNIVKTQDALEDYYGAMYQQGYDAGLDYCLAKLKESRKK